MEEIEVPTEAAQEEIHHHAHHAKESWISQVALTSALLAVFAAVTALLAGHHANEAMIEQIKASDHWGYYQAKSIKSALMNSKHELLAALGKSINEKDGGKLEEYRKQQEEVATQAKEKEAASAWHLQRHAILARGVTMFQVAIAIAAISVLTRRKRFWLLSLGFGAVGLGFLIQGLV